ncbi:hypothetical protein ACP70R_014607 [Stipagrostis hirtigluma subsp. patula]
MARPRPAPELMDELVEEVLIRCPPDDPGRLVRAALVCKPWCRVVSGAGFRRRYRQFHGSPPVLGFFYRMKDATRFMPTASFRPSYASFLKDWPAIDARHGRILFDDYDSLSMGIHFVVSNSITGDGSSRLPTPRPFLNICGWNAALLCAEAVCDHLECPGGPFRVVFMATDSSMKLTSACVYLSEACTWSVTISVEHPIGNVAKAKGGCRTLVVGNAAYFLLAPSCAGVLEYDVDKQLLSVISLPSVCEKGLPALINAEDGGLGFCTLWGLKFYMWSRQAGPNGLEWAQHRVIDLKSLLPDRPVPGYMPSVIAFADSVHLMLWAACTGVFDIHLKSGRLTELAEIRDYFHTIVPYTCFYTPRY